MFVLIAGNTEAFGKKQPYIETNNHPKKELIEWKLVVRGIYVHRTLGYVNQVFWL